MLTADQRSGKKNAKRGCETILAAFDNDNAVKHAVQMLGWPNEGKNHGGILLDKEMTRVAYAMAYLGLCMILEYRDMKAGD